MNRAEAAFVELVSAGRNAGGVEPSALTRLTNPKAARLAGGGLS
jgi:hypothetical protein